MKLTVLFEDNHSIAVIKPAGMPVQSDLTGDPDLLSAVRQHLKEKYGKPGEAYVGLVHRLDRPVGGVVIFAKTSKGASRLSEQFRDHQVRKIYWAAVEGQPGEGSGTVKQWIDKNKKANRAFAVPEPKPGSRNRSDAKYAELEYRVLRSETGMDGTVSLIEVEPKTGRSHQIRLAMSTLGCPILGDLKYGAQRPLPDGSRAIALFAQSLTFKTAVGDKEVTVRAKPNWHFITDK